jgi:adenylate cyclase
VYAEGLRCWRTRDFAGARASFARLADADLPARFFLERCEALLREPPAAGWEPIRDLESK